MGWRPSAFIFCCCRSFVLSFVRLFVRFATTKCPLRAAAASEPGLGRVPLASGWGGEACRAVGGRALPVPPGRLRTGSPGRCWALPRRPQPSFPGPGRGSCAPSGRAGRGRSRAPLPPPRDGAAAPCPALRPVCGHLPAEGRRGPRDRDRDRPVPHQRGPSAGACSRLAALRPPTCARQLRYVVRLLRAPRPLPPLPCPAVPAVPCARGFSLPQTPSFS